MQALPTIPLSLVLLVVTIVLACATAIYVYVAERQRRRAVSRADGRISVFQASGPILRDERASTWSGVADWMRRNLPGIADDEGTIPTLLVHAGFDGQSAPVLYRTVRLTLMVLLPLAAVTISAAVASDSVFVWVLVALGFALVAPRAYVDRRARQRQESIRRSLPDCLDLLVVCVEAGVSLDAALLRVSREMESVHPTLAGELRVVNRRINAGLSREEALHGLWLRTGVEELRALASSMIQSERWGTSISRVLRVNSDMLRRRRRQAAEKRAAEAALKMIIPLALFLLPALMAVIVGPAMLEISRVLSR